MKHGSCAASNSSENDPRYQMIVSAPFRRASGFFLRHVAFSICVTVIANFPLCAAEAASIHPGFSNLPDSIVDGGELLLGELNCVACHQADATIKRRLASKQAPVLGQEAITPQYLRKFLSNPQSVKPGSTMPDLLHGMEAPDRTSAADALTHFLISAINVSNAPAVAADEFKIQQGRLLYHQVGCVACHAPQEPPSILQSK